MSSALTRNFKSIEQQFTGLVASNFCSTYVTQAVYCAVFGLTSGAFNGLIGVILIDLIGLDKFTRAFGFQLLFIGVAIMIGPPIVGKLLWENNTY